MNKSEPSLAMAIDTEVLLNDQKRGVEIAYEVVAVNKAGNGRRGQ